MRRQAWVGRALRALAVGLLVLPFIGFFAQAAEAHHSDISPAADCTKLDGTWDFTYTVTAATSIGTPPADMENDSVQVWFVWDGPTPTSNTPPDFNSIGAVLDQTGAFVFRGGGLYPSFSGDGTAPAGVSKVTIWAVPTDQWSDGYSASGSARWAEVVSLGPCSVPATVSVSVGECTWNGESSETPVTVVIDPESGATVTIEGPGGPYEFTGTGGSVNLAPGSYSWSATAADGYELTGDTSGEFTAGSCAPPTTTTTQPTTTTTQPTTTTTQPPGSITISKVSLVATGTFAFESSTLGSFELTTTETGTAVSQTFTGLDAGIYDVSEGAQAAGWSLTSAVCSDESDPAAISLAAGEDVTCTFTNVYSEVSPTTVTNSTTTTTSVTTTETLPFTGASSGGTGGVAVALLLLGGLVLLAVRREDEEAGN